MSPEYLASFESLCKKAKHWVDILEARLNNMRSLMDYCNHYPWPKSTEEQWAARHSCDVKLEALETELRVMTSKVHELRQKNNALKPREGVYS